MSVLSAIPFETLIIGGAIIGVTYVQRSFILLVIRTVVELMVKDAIDREKQIKSIIYESQTMAKSQFGLNEVLEKGIETIPEINNLQEGIDNIKNDFVNFLPQINHVLESFENEIKEMICPPEVKEVCLKYFEDIQKVINGTLD